MKQILILILFFFLILGCRNKDDLKILNYNLDSSFSEILDKTSVEYSLSNNVYSVVNTSNNVQSLIQALKILELKQNVIIENISNANTTNTPEGGFYRRRMVVINAEGIPVIEFDPSLPYLVYDPNHPDAQSQGELEGFVQYPNISMMSEMLDLIVVSREIDLILTAINELDPSLIIPNPYSRENIKYIQTYSDLLDY